MLAIPWSVSVSVCLCLSVCLSRLYIVLKRQKKSTRFLLHTAAPVPCLSQIMIKFGLHRSTPFLPKYCHVHFLFTWVSGYIRWHTLQPHVRDSTVVTMESLYETIIILSNCTITDPLRPPHAAAYRFCLPDLASSHWVHSLCLGYFVCVRLFSCIISACM